MPFYLEIFTWKINNATDFTERWGKDQTKLFIVKCEQTSLKSHTAWIYSLLIKILMYSCTFPTSWYQTTSILKHSSCIHLHAKNINVFFLKKS